MQGLGGSKDVGNFNTFLSTNIFGLVSWLGFSSDPGVLGVRSLGPVLSNWERLLRQSDSTW